MQERRYQKSVRRPGTHNVGQVQLADVMRLDHINLYVSDLERSRAFYEKFAPAHGLPIVRDFPNIAVGFGESDYAVLALVQISEPVQPTHLAFRVDQRTTVNKIYEAALNAGATDNGAPGLRPHYHTNYYAGFVRDPDGHNLEFVCHEPSPLED